MSVGLGAVAGLRLWAAVVPPYVTFNRRPTPRKVGKKVGKSGA